MSTVFSLTDKAACLRYLIHMRWPEGLDCARCKRAMVFKAQSSIFKCSGCDKQVSATSGTVFHKSRIPLQVWFQTMRLMLESQKGISALRVQKTLHVRSYRAVWLMMHKIRAAMTSSDHALPSPETLENRRFVSREQIGPDGVSTRAGSSHGWSSKYHHAYAAEFSYRERHGGDLEKAFDQLLQDCITQRPVKLRDVTA